MPFFHTRTIRFQDTDAAGVVYFANLLSICHEAYEASLAASGINLKTFFQAQSIALPIIHASIDFRHPLFCGDTCTIQGQPSQLSATKFQIQYEIFLTNASESAQASEPKIAQAITIHLCIESLTRSRTEFPSDIQNWLQNWKEN